MSKYTTELRYICETYAGYDESQDYTKIDDIIANSRTKIFDFNFPIFDENYRSVLETKIIKHYYTREIGFETVALWKHFLGVKMNEIMESKLPLIYSAAISYDPLVNVDVETTLSRRVDDAGNANSSGLTINSDTPQGQINKEEILAGNYASSTQGGESTNSTTNQSIESSTTRTKGNSGVSATAQKMVLQYRENIRAIDYEIMKELNSLFMGLY